MSRGSVRQLVGRPILRGRDLPRGHRRVLRYLVGPLRHRYQRGVQLRRLSLGRGSRVPQLCPCDRRAVTAPRKRSDAGELHGDHLGRVPVRQVHLDPRRVLRSGDLRSELHRDSRGFGMGSGRARVVAARGQQTVGPGRRTSPTPRLNRDAAGIASNSK